MTCAKCGGLMHREWTPATRREPSIALLACFLCGRRDDYVIRLHQMFSGPRPDRRAEAWQRIRQLVAAQERVCH